MSIITIAIIILAAFLAALLRFFAQRGNLGDAASVRDAVSLGLSLLLFGLVIAAGPKVLGG